ncbi:MAG: sigma 54-interacting transcriptional regulator, partial [Vicinamibacterales bacterium]
MLSHEQLDAYQRALRALEQGRGPEAVRLLEPLAGAVEGHPADGLTVRIALAEGWLLQDDLPKASRVLGRAPAALSDSPGTLPMSGLWRLHGRVAFERGEPSRAIALHQRALRHADAAHDSRAIGLAHYELAHCYEKMGDDATVREHLARASSALHAAGDRRHLALVHSLSAVQLGQAGRYDEALAALRHAERLASAVGATDVLGAILHNQANVAMVRHRHDEALALAEQAVRLHESAGSNHGLAVALASLGQICVRVGHLARAEAVLRRALDLRSSVQYRETTGAVHDTLAQVHLLTGAYDEADRSLTHAREAFRDSGTRTSRWYEWSLKVLAARLALRRGRHEESAAQADAILGEPGLPPTEAVQTRLIAAEAAVALGRSDEARAHLAVCEETVNPETTPGLWAELLRVRAAVHEREHRLAEAHHDLSQSIQICDLLAERYQAGLGHLALGRLAAHTGDRSLAATHLGAATGIFDALGAARDLADSRAAAASVASGGTGENLSLTVDADDAIVRRLVDAAQVPGLLPREAAAALRDIARADAAVVYVQSASGRTTVLAAAGCTGEAAVAMAGAAGRGDDAWREALGRDPGGERIAVVRPAQPLSETVRRRLRLLAAVIRQGFDLSASRERRSTPLSADSPSLEPILPGFICASATMARVVEQIQRLKDHDLTVLITGESGTGKDLVARAIHYGSPRAGEVYLPYNCTSATRELADSQLFGHRRGAFTGAVADQRGLVREAAGGTLFLDEVGDLPGDVQPKLLRFLESGEILPVGEARPQHVQVRVLAATNADLEQRVAEGRFREDLFYRLSVFRIHVPPLRERRDEIPHLSTFFLRDACERLHRPDVQFSQATLDLFTRYWWPGNVRQL